MNKIYAFILTFLASFGTIIGSIPIFYRISDKFVLNVFKMAFIILIVVSIGELLPDSYILISNTHSKITTLLIILLFYLLGSLLTKYIDIKIGEGSKLYKLGIISTICIIIHNIIEGIITYITASYNIKLGIMLAITILIHNIPEGLLIALPIYKSTKKRGTALLFTIISGFSEFVGALLSYLIFYKYITKFILGSMYAFTIGIMITISIYEILPIIKNRML